MMELTLHVTYTARPGCREQFVRQIVTQGILDAIRAEAGCLQYEYYFSTDREEEILLVERWESEVHQRAHMSQAHMAQLRVIKEACIEKVSLKKMQEEDYVL